MKNNMVPRLAAFIISAIITAVVILSTIDSGIGFEGRIQFFSAAVLLFWALILVRAKGWKEYKAIDIAVISAIAVGLGLYMCVTVWHSGYLTINPLVGINAHMNGMNRDSLYHSAIAEGLKNYGYSTLLVNSDAFHNYHFGSHVVMAMMARLLDIPSFFSYCYCYPIFFFPLYIYLIFSVPVRIRRYLCKEDRISILDAIVLESFVTYMVFPARISDSLAMYKESWLISESYCVAATAFLLFFELLFVLLEKGALKNRKTELWFELVCIPLFIVYVSLAKISFGAVLACSIAYYFFRQYGFKPKYFMLEMLCAVSLLCVYFIPGQFYSPFSSASTGANYGIMPLYFLRASVADIDLWGLHFLVYFGFSLFFIIYRLKPAKSFNALWDSVTRKKYVIEETLILICIVGYIPGMLFTISGGSSFYISSIQQLIAVVLIVGYGIPNEIYRNTIIPTHQVYRFICMCLSVFLLSPFIMYSVKNAIILKQDFAANYKQYQESIKEDSYWSIVNTINKISADSKKDFYIYVDETAELWTRFTNQDAAMFFYPAMTGVVCIGEYYIEDGAVYTNDNRVKDYGWPIIPNVDEPKMTYEDALAKAKNDGKTGLICIYENTMSVEYLK